MRRTLNVSLMPVPRLPMTTPEKIWMRSLSPSTTLVCTRTVSPTLNLASSLRNCSDSIFFNNAWFINFQIGFLDHWIDGLLGCCNSLIHQSTHPSIRFQHVWPLLFRQHPGLL